MARRKNRWVLDRDTYLLEEGDGRLDDYRKYKKRHGFSPDETWNLDTVLAEFIIPRLKAFRKMTIGYPAGLTPRKWSIILGKMQRAFEMYLDCDVGTDEETMRKINEGLDLFRKYFMSLWW